MHSKPRTCRLLERYDSTGVVGMAVRDNNESGSQMLTLQYGQNPFNLSRWIHNNTFIRLAVTKQIAICRHRCQDYRVQEQAQINLLLSKNDLLLW
jgi:hypothetical protein